MYWACFALLACVQRVLSAPSLHGLDSNDFVVKHSWKDVPRGWELRGPAPANYTLNLHISLKQAKFDELVANLWQVSDPAHERSVLTCNGSND